MDRRHEQPIKRINPSGKVRWVARYTGRDGKRRSAGTFAMKKDAQAAIDAAYDREFSDGRAPRQQGTVEVYIPHWERMHPRARTTARVYAGNLRAVQDVKVGGRPLKLWRMDELERSEIRELADHMLTVQGRAANGARAVLATLSAMWEDAIDDGWAKHNPIKGVRIRNSDPRIQKPRRTARAYSWDEMHVMAMHAHISPVLAMMRVLSDCGLRLGEMLPLERKDMDGDWLWVRRTATGGQVTAGTKTTRNCPEKARKVPLPSSTRLLIELHCPHRLDTPLLFPTIRGRVMQNQDFYAHWKHAVTDAGYPEARPHDFRHSYVSNMRAAGVDPAHLAEWTGHTVLTATTSYTHPVGDVSEQARRAVG